MANYTHDDIRKTMGEAIKSAITAGAIVKNPVKTDSWAETQNKIVAKTPYNSTDVSIVESGENILVTYNGKSGVDQDRTAEASDDICFLALDETNEKVLQCLDINDREVTNENGDSCSWPQLIFRIRETGSAGG